MPVGPETTWETGSPLKLRPWNTILKDKDHGWSPLFWVAYLGFFFIDPVMSHASFRIWLLDGIGAAVFLVLYFGLFVLQHPRAHHAHRRDGAARPAVPAHQSRRMHVLYLRGGDASVFRRKPNRGFVGLGAIGAIGAIEGIAPARRRLDAFLLCAFSRDHWRGKYLLCRAQPHEPEAAQGERRDRDIWPKWPSASASRAICMMYSATRCR